MKLSVIGGYGQVGQEFKKLVSPDDLVLIGHDRIDVADKDSVRKCLQEIDCDIVINLAAFHNTNQCEIDRGKAFRVNTEGAYNVAKVSNEMNRKTVYFSSDYVFGFDDKRSKPYMEHDPVAPVNIYGVSKSAGEMLVRAANKNHLIIRTSSLFGAVTSKKGWTFPEMIYNKARAGEPLKVVSDQVMAPTYTYELVQTVLEFLKMDATGTIHIAGGGQCSWHDFACSTVEYLNIPVEIAPVASSAFPSPAKRPAYSVLGSVNFNKYKIKPMSHWKEGLFQFLKEKGELNV